MKKILIIFLLIASAIHAYSQNKVYKEYNACTDYDVYKGKKNHGQKYCVAWATIREYKDGRKDTVAWFGGGKMQWGDEIGKYDKLSERGKYIVDSLKEDGITQLHDAYLTYEPIYMKAGKKIEQLWAIEGDQVFIFEYLFWKSEKGHGIKLVREFKVN